jgi:hypothetical protein
MKKMSGLLATGLLLFTASHAQTPLTSANFNSYAPTLTGTGASGAWGIDITGSATSWSGKSVNYANFHGPLDVNGLLGTNTSYPGVVTAFSNIAVRGWLGIPGDGETLQSVTNRGNITDHDVTVGQLFAYRSGSVSTIAAGSPATGKTQIAMSTSADAGGYGIISSVQAQGTAYGNTVINPSGGNVGIGTTSPLSKLAVNGDISLSNRMTFADGTLYSDVNNMASFHNGGFIWSSADNSTTKMSLSSNGDLFVSGDQVIGRNWAQKNLDVNGIIKTRKVKVTQTDWPDYVFDSSYQLAPLHQVEKYIQQNKHLPAVPSAAEVKKEGIDLGDNQAILLKKIEELTLYIIEQEKRIKKLEEERK